MTSTNNIYGIEDDPVLGKFVAYYPSNRLRLLMLAGAILLAVWFVTTVVLWQVEAGIASLITVIILAIAALLVGWFMLHLWNRAVILFEQGFSYREGSRTAFIPYDTVLSVQLHAERRSYFGGLVRFNIYQLELFTDEDELIHLNGFYSKIDELSLYLEIQITETQLIAAREQIKSGGNVRFEGHIIIDGTGIHQDSDTLKWAEFGGHRVQNRQLEILQQDGTAWTGLPLAETANIRLLTRLLQERVAELTNQKANTP